ncbi:MAG TPA: ATP-binding cassette domain-containing protein [Patescibacteria group bacterium]|nr:ATP-binding cassette domain-containing protein [Patescibacteria group bacterium]
MNNNTITIRGLTKSFGKLKVLEGINLNVEQGTILALLGPNGAGKTTTVRILSTLIIPDDGEVTVNGYDVVEQADEVRGSIGLTGQYAAVDEYLTGQENLEMMGRLYHLSKADSKRRAQELLQQFDLVDAAARSAKTYSGGMRRRLDLAASLVATPPIVFLDEPTTGLDPRSRLAMWDIIQQLRANNATILLTTQYLEEADKLADRIAVIDRGQVIAEGTAADLKSQVGEERLVLVVAKESHFDLSVKAMNVPDMQINAVERTMSIAIKKNVSEVKQVLDRMEQAHIEIDSLSLHKPTLDDVFLRLTGDRELADNVQNKSK